LSGAGPPEGGPHKWVSERKLGGATGERLAHAYERSQLCAARSHVGNVRRTLPARLHETAIVAVEIRHDRLIAIAQHDRCFQS
jgi:hypothetical protein